MMFVRARRGAPILLAGAAVLLLGAPAAGQIASSGGAGEAAAGVGQAPATTLIDDQRGTSGANQPTLLQDQRAGRRALPFGSELFAAGNAPGAPAAQSSDPNYVLRPGDHIQVSSFGLVNEAQELTIDPAGNIVIPNVGPVKVAGMTAGQVNAAVTQATGKVFQSTVKTYASAVSTGNTNVFVAGPVAKPGVQAGSGSDSIVGFLQRAGGIDADRGSYRHIIVRRQGQVIAEADLYAFLLNGDLPPVTLRSGDVIVVGQQGPIVSVSGNVRAPFTFEFADAGATGAELLRYARPRPEVTHVSILGTRNNRPFNAYMTRADFARFPLLDGDRVGFEADAPADTFVVRVQGANDGPSAYTVNRGDALGPFIRQLQLDRLADRPMIHLERQSIADAQKQLLDESLARLEKAIYTSNSPTPGVAQARAQSAAGLETYIARARQVQPKGLVSLPEGADLDHVLLEPDDTIVVPYVSQTVVIAGEVQLPQTVLWTSGGDAKAYVAQAGGYTNRANRSDTLVIHPDGSTQKGGAVRAGDRILVPPKLGSQPLELVKDLTQILYQIGIAGLSIAKL